MGRKTGNLSIYSRNRKKKKKKKKKNKLLPVLVFRIEISLVIRFHFLDIF